MGSGWILSSGAQEEIAGGNRKLESSALNSIDDMGMDRTPREIM